jgi:peptidoglycan/LPS O-acetylase OafA/YrhL
MKSDNVHSQAPDSALHFERIDVLRGVAILLVLMCHYWAAATQGLTRAGMEHPEGWGRLLLAPMEFGHQGVKLFFVLSGFCIHLSYLKWLRKHSEDSLGRFLPEFYWRRFFRIYPPYLLALLIFWLCVFSPNLDLRAIWHFIVHAAMAHSLSEPFFFEINWSFWSIAVEWQLYMVYPLFLLMARWKNVYVAGLIAGVVATMITFYGSSITTSYLLLKSPFAFWLEWCAGAVIAEHYFYGRRTISHPGHWAMAVGIVYTLSLYWDFHFVIDYFVGTLFFGLLILAALSARKPLPSYLKPVAALGIVSYSVYLLHQPLLVWSFEKIPSAWIAAIPSIALWTVVPMLVYAVLLVPCVCFYRWVELPSIALGRRFSLWKPKSPPKKVVLTVGYLRKPKAKADQEFQPEGEPAMTMPR